MRIPAIDFAKTIGIALVVFGHISGMGESDVMFSAKNIVNQFHVPLFFFLSGFCFKENDSWKAFLVKRIKGLYLPFVTCNLFFYIIHLIAHRLNGEAFTLFETLKSGIKILCGYASSPLGGASWFLITLFLSLVLFKLLLAVLSKCRHALLLTLAASLVLSILGTQITLPWGHEKTMVALFFIAAGHATRSFHLLERINSRLFLPLIVAGSAIVWLCSRANYPNMALHQYGNLPLYYLAALAGTFTIILICQQLVPIQPLSFLGKWGQKTIWILLGQFAAFKLVSIWQVLQFGQPLNAVLSQPCYYIGGIWGPIYLIAGFFIPLFISKIVLYKKPTH